MLPQTILLLLSGASLAVCTPVASTKDITARAPLSPKSLNLIPARRSEDAKDSDEALGNYQGKRSNNDADETTGNYVGKRSNDDADEALGDYQGKRSSDDADEALGSYQGKRSNDDADEALGSYQG